MILLGIYIIGALAMFAPAARWILKNVCYPVYGDRDAEDYGFAAVFTLFASLLWPLVLIVGGVAWILRTMVDADECAKANERERQR